MTKNLIVKKKKIIKAMEKLQKSFQLGKKSLSFSTTSTTSDLDEYNEEEKAWIDDSSSVPEDVKEGHFAVVAMDEEYGLTKRFVVPLRYLTHPMFLALLERAAEEYGFDHGGALTIPCRPSELERILAQGWENDIDIDASRNVVHGCGFTTTLNSNMLESC